MTGRATDATPTAMDEEHGSDDDSAGEISEVRDVTGASHGDRRERTTARFSPAPFLHFQLPTSVNPPSFRGLTDCACSLPNPRCMHRKQGADGLLTQMHARYRAIPMDQLLRRHAEVRSRLRESETARDDNIAKLKRLRREHDSLQKRVTEHGANLHPGGFADLPAFDIEEDIWRHLLCVSKLAAAEVESEALVEAVNELQVQISCLDAELALRAVKGVGDRQRGGVVEAAQGNDALSIPAPSPHVLMGSTGASAGAGEESEESSEDEEDDSHEEDEDDEKDSEPSDESEEGSRSSEETVRKISLPSEAAHARRATSPPLKIQPAEKAGMPFTLEQALQHSKEARIITDVDGKTIVHVNEAWERLCGYTAAEACGKSLKTLLQGPRTEQAILRALKHAVIVQGACVEAKLTNYRKDGSEFCNCLRVTPLHSDTHGRRYLGVLSLVEEERIGDKIQHRPMEQYGQWSRSRMRLAWREEHQEERDSPSGPMDAKRMRMSLKNGYWVQPVITSSGQGDERGRAQNGHVSEGDTCPF